MTGSLALLCLSVITFTVGQDYRTWTGPGVLPPEDRPNRPRRSSFLASEKISKGKMPTLDDDDGSSSLEESNFMRYPFPRPTKRPLRPKSDELPSISTMTDTISKAIKLWWDMGKKAMDLFAMTNQKNQYLNLPADSLPGLLWKDDNEDSKKSERKPSRPDDDLEDDEDRKPKKKVHGKKTSPRKPSRPDSEPKLDVSIPDDVNILL